MAIGTAIGIPFNNSRYWTPQTPLTLKAISISGTEQTITAILTGTDFDGVSWERSIDNATWIVDGTSVAGTYNATGLTASTKYYWRSRLYKGASYGTYSNTDWDVTFPTVTNVGFIFKIKSTSVPIDGGDGFYYTEDLKLRLASGVYYVHTWYDKSGNNNHGVQTVDASQPVYNAVANEVIFNATTDPFLKVTHSATIDITTGDVSISYKIGKTNCINFLMNKGVGTPQIRFWLGDDLRYYDVTPSGQINKTGGISEAIGDLISLVLDRDTAFTAYKNTTAGTPQAFNYVANLHTTEDLYIGKLGGTVDTTMSGNVNFICLHAKAYSQADVNELASYTTQMQPEYLIENITYPSTINAITNLAIRKATRADRITTPLPLLICMHGWSQDTTYLPDVYLKIRADQFFVAVVGMRDNSGASGNKDVSGRELHDIYDAVQYCLANYGSYIDPTRIVIEGQSGGGGNTLGVCCKFPDLFNVAGTGSAISDYGFDDTNSWYITNGSFCAASLDGYIGTPRANKLKEYQSRDAVEAITNYQGYIYMVHHDGDTTVNVVHSQRIVTALGVQTNFTYTEIVGANHPSNIDSAFYTRALTEGEKTIPLSGTVRVIGYMITKRFKIWLDSGISSVADVTYDVSTDTYTVTPVTAADIAVVITQGSKTASQTISGVTVMVVS